MSEPLADHLVGALSTDGGVLVRAAVTTDLCEAGRRAHATAPTASAALGRALTGALLLGSLLKGRQTVLLQWRGGGPLGTVLAEARPDLSVRGYVGRPQAVVPSRAGKLDVGTGVGHRGELVVVKDLGLREPYVSSVALQSGEIGDDLAYYLLVSEQIPSAVGLGVHIAADYRIAVAGGILVETLPGAPPERVEQVAENMGRLGSVTRLLSQRASAEALVAAALEGMPYRTSLLGVPRFTCQCGPERLDATLAALGPDEVRDVLEKEGELRARCAFCASEWRKGSLDATWERSPER
ncbi:MAG: Hsp33 family molecular chaperone HslO [Proteobacteria bacterium]|nr:Hsp33 family molecular chaperone HslO [Pseudomonadota bacterium]